MKYLLASAVLAILLCSISIEATSEPICSFAGRALRRNVNLIQLKYPQGCSRKFTCDENYNVVRTECNRLLCPADKALNIRNFPDCCCY